MTVFDMAQHLGAKRNGKGWIAKCPAHTDQKPSLSIGEGRNGCVLLKCHAGCTLDEIVAAAGKTERDLFNESTPPKSAAPFDWSKCMTAFTNKHAGQIAKW